MSWDCRLLCSPRDTARPSLVLISKRCLDGYSEHKRLAQRCRTARRLHILYILPPRRRGRVSIRTGNLMGYKWFCSHVTFCSTQKCLSPLTVDMEATQAPHTYCHEACGLPSARKNKSVHAKNPP